MPQCVGVNISIDPDTATSTGVDLDQTENGRTSLAFAVGFNVLAAYAITVNQGLVSWLLC